MLFVETPVFTRAVMALLTDEESRKLQLALLLRPQQGAVIRGGGGLRKLRWSAPGRGKRGDTRVIYYWHREEETFYMLHVFAKNDQEDLTPEQIRVLRGLVREEFS